MGRGIIRYLMPALLGVTAYSSAASQADTPVQPEGRLEWIACPFDTSRAVLPVRCGKLNVPENYDDPDRRIEIGFMVVSPRRNIDPDHPVIFLSGGPGSPTVVHAERLVATPGIRETVVDRDWVFIDQRGGGRSTPALYCPPQDDWFDQVQTCRDRLIGEGADLSQYNSARSARDIEALRRALGVAQWNLWGASYGSRLAFTVARYYPASVRSIVHDGAYLPEDQEIVEDLRGTEVALNRLFSKCADDAACASRFPELRSRFLAALPRLRQQPLSVGNERFDDARVMGFVRNWFFGGFYSTFDRRLQNLLVYMDAAGRGDGARMLATEQRMTQEERSAVAAARPATPGAPFPIEGRYHVGQNLSIDCHDEKGFESMDEYAQASAESEVVRALFGEDRGLAIFRTCALWPAGRADPIEDTHVDYDGPQLVLSGELDASLSGLAGYKIDMLYANATHVVFRNSPHIQLTMEDSDLSKDYNHYRLCAARLARQFLADPHQALDTRCAETRILRLVP